MIKWHIESHDSCGPSWKKCYRHRNYESADKRFYITKRYERGNGYDRAGFHWVLIDRSTKDQNGRYRVLEGAGSCKQAKQWAEEILQGA